MSKNNYLKKKILIGLATASVLCGPMGIGYAVPDVTALPTDGKIAQSADGTKMGEVSFDKIDDSHTLNVFQTSKRAIIDWESFNVGKDATVNFVQTLNGKPNVAAMTLNRVNAAGGMSEIAGQINSIGSFLLVNPNGIMFYEGSAVNAAGVVLSTAEINADEFYNNGRLYFSQSNATNNNITINGSINASTNGSYLTGADGMLAKLKEQVDNSALNLDGIEFATGFSVANNVIKLVADGDIIVGNKGSLQAVTSTTLSGDKTVGTEEFSVEGESSTREGSITLRADQNADDINADNKAAKVYLNNDDAAQIASHSVGIYYNPDLVEHDVDGVKKDINGAKVADLGLANTGAETYTQKDYTKYSEEAAAYKSKVAQSFNEFSRNDAKEAVTKTRDIRNQSYNMLVNNLYQMEAIQYSNKSNMGGSYAQGTSFGAADTKNWNGGKGFNSIGSTNNVFHGSFTGHGGSNTYSITDLSINRSDENNIGLFGVAKGASFWSVNLVDSNIIGHDNVGGIAGSASDHSKFSSISVRKRVTEYDKATTKTLNADNVAGNDNVGGIVGNLADGTIRFSNNGAQVSGHDNVGGLAGNLSGVAEGGSEEGSVYNVYKSSNNGFYSDTETIKETVNEGYGVIKSTGKNAGGLVGSLASTNKDATGIEKEAVIESKSNGQVQGTNNVGGLVGDLASGTVKWSYNTNEDAALSKNSVVDTASVGAGTSVYGQVTGGDNVGGIIGFMSGGKVEESYNAGNVSGTTNVGGVVGNMSGGEIAKAYNADNNTVLKSSTNDAEYYGFTVKNESGIVSYTYDHSKQTWLKNGTEIITAEQLKAVPENTRTYYNRLAYRDATVTGTENVGGVVGSMSGGSINEVYNAGQVKTDGTSSNIGAFTGEYTGGTINNSFYVTTENDRTKIAAQDKAIGNDVAVAGITAKTLHEAQNTNDTKWTGDANKNTGNGWTIYNNSSTPLLNHFMKWININRQYEYDGTVHNLMTTDVANYYGGAFFDNGDGKNVYSTNPRYGLVKDVMGGYKASDWVIKSGSANADTSHSSVYTYDNSTMWSPQHGYYTHDDARMIITPKTVTATLTGEKTYGENAVEGVATNAEDKAGKYTMTFGADDFIGDDTADSVFAIDRSVAIYKNDKNQLGVDTYDNVDDFTNPTFNRKDNNYNYNVEFKDTLTVNKADLLVDIVGTKVYGDTVNKGSYKYYAHGQNTDTADDKLNNGKLKSWETTLTTKDNAKALNKDTVTALAADMTVSHNNKDTGEKTITTGTDVIGHYDESGKFIEDAYTLSKAEISGVDDTNKVLKTLENNYNLIFDMAKGSNGKVTVTPKTINMVVEGEKIYGQDALKGGVVGKTVAEASKNGNYSVKIEGYIAGDNPALEADFKDIAYTGDAGDDNKLAVGVYTDTTNTSAHFTNPSVTNTKFSESEKINHNYTGKITNKLTVKKADLYINIDGSKQYGDSINGTSATYTYSAASKNDANATGTATEKDKLNDGSLKSWDSLPSDVAINKMNITSLTANDDVYHNDKKQENRDITANSNVITDSKGNIVAYDLEKAGFKDNTFNNLKNYNVIFDTNKGSKGTMTVNPAKLTVKSTGTKNYGDAPLKGGVLGTTSEKGKYAVSVTGYVAGDTTSGTFDVKLDNVKSGADNEKLAVGTYTDKNSTDFTNPVFTPKKSNTRNYDIIFNNELTVKAVEPTPTTSTVPSRGSSSVPTTGSSTIPASEPAATPVVEPSTAPVSEPVKTPTAEPITAPVSEPTTTPVSEPTTTPVAEPTVAPTTEPSKIITDVIIEIKETTEVINAESKEVTEESKKIRYGGYIPKDSRDGIRFITVEDTGINVEEAKIENTTITVAPDSVVDNSDEVIMSDDVDVAAE
ncbi:surface protein [Anaerovibrio sp. JC8]|uniref:filamentous hemagglutinin N-terminal domain-containing protein n=1 Tax=Anaerovibrio sp. JC8 TaxID=1240085 RepID=UPI000A0BC07B|nr:filamentous hemagglutinin N-terminal domain-containing protein [Anaerovibrio sp. JC8]ORT99722.1 surface protein [Anaerovibrio sp. JC8]